MRLQVMRVSAGGRRPLFEQALPAQGLPGTTSEHKGLGVSERLLPQTRPYENLADLQ